MREAGKGRQKSQVATKTLTLPGVSNHMQSLATERAVGQVSRLDLHSELTSAGLKPGTSVKLQWATLLLAIAACGVPAAAQKSELPSAPSSTLQSNAPRFEQNRFNRNLPDAPSSAPISDREKFDVFLENAGSSFTFAGAGLNAMGERARAPYGVTYSWTRAYTLALAQRESNEFLGKFVFPALLNQDPRYHPSDSDNIVKRAMYAASRVAITRTDNGHKTLNTSYLLSTILTSTLANAYRPQWARSVSNTAGDIGSTIGGDAGFDVFREFWPQISKKLANKTPKSIKKLQQKFGGDD